MAIYALLVYISRRNRLLQLIFHANDINSPIEIIASEEAMILTIKQAIHEDYRNKLVTLQGRLDSLRVTGKVAFIRIRKEGVTMQAILRRQENRDAFEIAVSLSKESVISVTGRVTKAPVFVNSCHITDFEFYVNEIRCISKAEQTPFELSDASRSIPDEARFLEAGGQVAHVNQNTRLDNRAFELRTATNQAIFKIQSAVCQQFRDSLLRRDFVEIHTPKLVAGVSESGSAVFKTEYYGQEASLAQSPQLFKQMAICADMERVFEIGPVFRAEKSTSHRHLSEFVGLDFEMTCADHRDVMQVADDLLREIFGQLRAMTAETDRVRKQFPFDELKLNEQTPRISFTEAVKLLQDEGIELDCSDDLTQENEKQLGQMIRRQHGTDIFFLEKFPTSTRPFYTMPCSENPEYSMSFDIIMRGEEICSGSQRISDHEQLLTSIHGKQTSTAFKAYTDAFKYGVEPHGGAGFGLERIVMLFLGLDNVRKTSLFPRDYRRISP